MMKPQRLKRTIADRFDEELRFFRGWIDKPKAVGSIVPTSSVTARRMASVITPQSGLPVLELGPGTGVITKAILARGVKPENLYTIEYSEEFVRHLREDFPAVNVIQGDAFDIDRSLGDRKDLVFDTIVSGVPLLNFPIEKRVAYVQDLLDRMPPGRPIVQITYGPLSPVPAGRGD
jgi:phosphatidylethanolamine/phosphatidyl-N-methylethanolamine N-methyltransferase